MGIRFICPECEKKIHVKSFLAGKRGICPKCSGKVQIPTESTTGRHAKTGRAQHDQRPTEAGPPVPPGGYATASVPYSPSVTAGSSPAPATVTAVAPVSQAALAQASIPTALPSSPSPSAPSAPNGRANPLPSHLVGPAQVSPAEASPTPSPAVASPTQPTTPAPDPLAETPNAKWYVRPPSGGQFGPAAADCMRRWLTEGRVSADSLVWREGWADWKKSSDVFAELGAGPATAVATPPEPAVASAAPDFPRATSAAGARTYRRKKSSSSLVVGMVSSSLVVGMVVTLALLAVGLLIGFVVLMMNS